MSQEGPRTVTGLARAAAVLVPSAGTAVAFVVMSHFHLLGETPVWLVLALLFVAALIGEGVGRLLLRPDQREWVLHVGVGLQCLTIGAVIYAIGWGPTLAIGFLFVAATALDLAGSRVWYVVAVWAAVATALGQIAIATGLAYSYVAEPWVHGLAALAVL
ncbi:MAG: hypothetical protein JO368_03350, partial [Acidimicrobiales bacterium]|nr:hypothetical protein [Acidimicrobiales bacterium]